MKKVASLSVIVLILCAAFSYAQKNQADDVHIFQTYLKDAVVFPSPYGEAGLIFSTYEYFKSFQFGIQGGFPITEAIEVAGQIGFLSWSPDEGDGESGLTDLTVSGRYNFLPGITKVSAGGYVTLPIGEEKIGQSRLNFGAFGALRHSFTGGIQVSGTLGLDFFETTTYEIEGYELKEKTEYETSFLLGGGGIFPINEQISVVSELNIWTEGDYMLLTGGVDYKLSMGGRLRGALGIGLDDGAPDFLLSAGFLYPF
ncbi:hypothetical protein JXI42_12775 [bacterium]|nr:hypothetical protein [bacterium]